VIPLLEIIVQYILLVAIVLGISYFVYLLKEKDAKVKEDYYGITYTLLTLQGDEATEENIKKTLRAIGEAVIFVEENFKTDYNNIKEEKALVIAKELIGNLDLKSSINDKTIKHIIKLICAILPSANKKSI
jgi:uncharacterized protein with HEPN domain